MTTTSAASLSKINSRLYLYNGFPIFFFFFTSLNILGLNIQRSLVAVCLITRKCIHLVKFHNRFKSSIIHSRANFELVLLLYHSAILFIFIVISIATCMSKSCQEPLNLSRRIRISLYPELSYRCKHIFPALHAVKMRCVMDVTETRESSF